VHLTTAKNAATDIIKAMYREPVTGPQSPGIMHRQSTINNKPEPKPAPEPTPKHKPNLNPTLTLP